ncbi:YaiO family outer membrane beta-barrel protein [Flavobacterium luteum]|nr:YaiO family outer membrane beta-barrel protein [Flavobacterium luteum]
MMISKTVTSITILFAFFCFFQGNSQEIKFKGDPDVSFETARNLAFNKQRKQAQDTLMFILTKYPNYHDVRAFLATTYSWDGDYKKARSEFKYILERDSNTKSTWVAAINNELWSNSPFVALELSNEVLKKFPNDAEILYLKANAEENANHPQEALNIIELLLAKNPEFKKAIDYKETLLQKLRKNIIGFRSEVDVFSDVFDPFEYYTLKYGRQTKYGSMIAKINYDRRFNDSGIQYEIDLYPRISNGFYTYLNFGFASSDLFPNIRYGAELYKSLPKSFEASLGFRTLKFSTVTNIYTGSIGWYTGNDYWTLRTYLTPGDAGLSSSGTLAYRKYRKDANNFIGCSLGLGISPENNQFFILNETNSTIILKSQKFRVEYDFSSKSNKHIWGTQFGIIHQEKSFKPGEYFFMYTFTLAWELNFK